MESWFDPLFQRSRVIRSRPRQGRIPTPEVSLEGCRREASPTRHCRSTFSGAEQFGTGHDLNDGALIISPLANGGRLLGGIDAETGTTYGFDPATGTPDRGRQMT